jgi:hypothetical protein
MAVNRIRVSQIKSESPDLKHFGEQLAGQGKPYYQLFEAQEGQTQFSLTAPYTAKTGELMVFLNGQKVTPTTDPSLEDGVYHEVDAYTIELVEPAFLGDVVECMMEGKGQGIAMVVDHFHIYREKPVGEINTINRVFHLNRTPKKDSEMVFRNGMLLNMGDQEDYVIQGDKIIFNDAPPSGSKILVNYDVSYV